jgi:pimeloyl-ACP methyl ester carboxylesterase
LIARTPLYFGREDRPLFGWIHTTAKRGDLGMVICPPLGHEYVHSHRALRHLADAFARNGVPAMRFDYDGTGDSAGQDDDPDRVAAWLDSIREAIKTLRDATGCTRIGLLGVRVGATLAAMIAAESVVECVVSWGSVRGRQYLRELKALQLVGGGTGGLFLTDETRAEIAALEAPETSSRVLNVAAEPEMFAPPHAAVVPHETIREIVQWVGAGDTGGTAPSQFPIRLRAGAESIAWFDRMFAIVHDGDPDAPTILLPNAGATHHVGPNRLYVFLARALSRAGFRVIRLDLPGLGDSVIDDVSEENDAYAPSTSADIASVIAAEKSVVLAGLCSGAHAAFHAALALENAPIVESVLINPLTFYYKRGMSLEQPLKQFDQWQWYMRSMRRRDRWAKLLRGQVQVGDVARVAFQRFRAGMRRNTDDLGRDLRRIAESGRKLTFVFSRFDPGYDLLMHAAAPAVRELRGKQQLALWRIDDADHTFEAKHSRDAMIDSLVRHLSARYLTSGAPPR